MHYKKKDLEINNNSLWDFADKDRITEIFNFGASYIEFINRAKTERETVNEILSTIKKAGFYHIKDVNAKNRLYIDYKNKNLALAVLGKRDLKDGLRIIVSHIDAPRLDLKPNPLYEDQGLSLFKTHYYGGIKKYHWMGIPLSLHGIIIKADGSALELSIGEKADDPVFTIADLLPHLSKKIVDNKKVSAAFIGEKLTIIIGSRPFPGKEIKNRLKLGVLDYLNKNYGLIEEDLISAELEIVPSFKAREIGFDRSLIGAYGQDDRICVYTSLNAILAQKNPEYTNLILFLDKEEIGSEGNTGAQSLFLERVLNQLFLKIGIEPKNYLVQEAFSNAKAISADVHPAINPNYPEVHDIQNATKLGYGVTICKYNGSGGKYHSSDAHAEYLGQIRNLFNQNKIAWQIGELGKIDEGGGGTIAKYLAIYGMDIIDCGVSLLGMHSPFEIASKIDLYETFRAYCCFLNKF
ncbi:MAG: aminopeptidase [bacterium]